MSGGPVDNVGAQAEYPGNTGKARFSGMVGLRLGFTIREANAADLQKVEALARSSFPIPDWLFSYEANRMRYRPGGAAPGTQVQVVQDADGDIIAHMFYTFLAARRLHIVEMAACPPPPIARAKGVGVLLLRLAGEEAFRNGSREVSLTVVAPHRLDLPGVWRDPSGFYRRFGFEHWPDYSPRDHGDQPYFAEDAHMRADPLRLLRLTRVYLSLRQSVDGGPTGPLAKPLEEEADNGNYAKAC
jgi:hypothetical protein